MLFLVYRRFLKALQAVNARLTLILPHNSHLSANALEYIVPACDLTRIPEEWRNKLPRSVVDKCDASTCTSISFATDAKKIELLALYKSKQVLSNMPDSASSGIDVYVCDTEGAKEKQSISPSSRLAMSACGVIERSQEADMFLVYFCNYAALRSVRIRYEGSTYFLPQKNTAPLLVVYGSSISQGCAASSPGKSYANIVARELGFDLINWGFSESARGELDVARCLSRFHARVYILEYDHNSSTEELESNHGKFFCEIRTMNPESIIVLMSRFSGGLSVSKEEAEERRRIIERTYRSAKASGDNRVVYIAGENINDERAGQLFEDDRHPNDLGMKYIAGRIITSLKNFELKGVERC